MEQELTKHLNEREQEMEELNILREIPAHLRRETTILAPQVLPKNTKHIF